MSFDTAIGVVSLAIGFGAVILGIAGSPEPPNRRTWIVAFLTTCGVALVLIAMYYVFVAIQHQRKIKIFQETIVRLLSERPLTFEQIRDDVEMIEINAAPEDVLEATELLRAEKRITVSRIDFEDQNDRSYYSKIYKTLK